MSIEEELVHRLHELPRDKQKQVLDFVEALSAEKGRPPVLRSLYGLWSGFDIRIDDEDIASARQEMWDGFPREAP